MPNHHEYLLMSEQVYNQKGGKLPQGWEILANSDDSACSQNGYFGCAYVNKTTKEIVISNRGCNGSSDVTSRGLELFLKQLPATYPLAKKFSDGIHQWAKNNSYTITFTGHSLGGAFSEILAHDFEVNTVNFESTGTKKIILDKFGKINSEIEIINYLSDKNPCNSHDNHVGKILYVDLVPSEDKAQKKSSDDTYHYVMGIVGNILSFVGGDAFKIVGTIGAGLLLHHNLNQVNTYHSIATWSKSFELDSTTGQHKKAEFISESDWLAKSRSGVASVLKGVCEGFAKQAESTSTYAPNSSSFFPSNSKRKYGDAISEDIDAKKIKLISYPFSSVANPFLALRK